jgi:hypothetical protein
MSKIDNSPTPTADLERGASFGKQDGSATSEADSVYSNAECSWLGAAGQFYDLDGLLVSTPVAPLQSQSHAASVLPETIPTEQFLAKALASDDGISDLFTPEIQYWEEDILAWSDEYGLDPDLIATVMQIESCGYSKAKSVAGAMGLFQVMPPNFQKEDDPYDPDTNAYRGLSWLQRTLKGGGSISMALAGYNAGLARVSNPNLEWPTETQRYVNWGVQIYQDAKCDYDYSSALYNWLSKGGSSLCDRAAVEQQDK